MISIIKLALESLSQWLKLKNRTMYVDLLERMRDQKVGYIERISKLRDRGTDASMLEADLLTAEWKRLKVGYERALELIEKESE